MKKLTAKPKFVGPFTKVPAGPEDLDPAYVAQKISEFNSRISPVAHEVGFLRGQTDIANSVRSVFRVLCEREIPRFWTEIRR